MPLFYVKKQEPIGHKQYYEYAVRKSGTPNKLAAQRMADRVGGFVTEYPGGNVVYVPKVKLCL